MTKHINLKLFATLQFFSPPNAEHFPVKKGTAIRDVLVTLGVPLDEVKLVFLDGIKADLTSELHGGERVGVFPPIGGG